MKIHAICHLPPGHPAAQVWNLDRTESVQHPIHVAIHIDVRALGGRLTGDGALVEFTRPAAFHAEFTWATTQDGALHSWVPARSDSPLVRWVLAAVVVELLTPSPGRRRDEDQTGFSLGEIHVPPRWASYVTFPISAASPGEWPLDNVKKYLLDGEYY
jgi:hypothetical protein